MKKPLDTLATLQAIGFSDKEARTYLASLALGPATVADIAAQAKLTRPSVYLMIESLERRGMMASYKAGKKSMYRASPPMALRYINAQARSAIAKKEQAVGMMIESLRTVSGGDHGIVIKFLDGQNATNLIQDGALSTKIHTCEIVNLQRSRQSIPLHYDGDKRLAIIKKDNYKSVCEESEGFSLGGRTKARSSRSGRNIEACIEIIDNISYLDSSLTGHTIIQVANNNFSNTLRAMFESLHNESRELS